mmetsp:Transcript_19596/g.52683  ORF Transcript_19596/g.52683 Transcript_19596/m.52683 type:complete len:701 (-) Transcript_19596:354-2456(-)
MTAGSVDGVIKVAIHAEVSGEVEKLRESLDERLSRLEKRLEETSGRIEESARDARELRESAVKHKAEAEIGATQLKADLEALGTALRGQLQRYESDSEGPGGLQQLRDRLDSIAHDLSAVEPKLQEQAKSTRAIRGRMDNFEESLTSLTRNHDSLKDSHQKSIATLQSVELASSAVEERQRTLEDTLARKHEKLWQDVHRAVEEIRNDHAAALHEDMVKRREEMKQHNQSHVKYVTQLLATAHTERKSLASCKGLLQVWREQTWAEQRRKTGLRWLLNALSGVTEHRARDAVARWSRATALEGLSARLRDEYKAQIPDVHKIIESTGLKARCDGFDGHLDTIRKSLDEKCPKISLDEAMDSHSSRLQAHVGELQDMKSQMSAWVKEHREALDKHKEALDSTDQKHTGHKEALLAHRTDIDVALKAHASNLTEVSDRLGGFAKAEELQTMMRDVLVIWSSIKQLDAAKADKTALDAFAMEVTNNVQQTTRKAEDLQTVIGGKVQEETTKFRGEMDSKIGHWETMWSKLAGLVEDLLGKVGDLQAAGSNAGARSSSVPRDASRDSGAVPEGNTLRPSSLPPTPGSVSGSARNKSNSSMPTLRQGIPQGGSSSVAGSAAAAVASLQVNGAAAGSSSSTAAEGGMECSNAEGHISSTASLPDGGLIGSSPARSRPASARRLPRRPDSAGRLRSESLPRRALDRR